MIYYHSKLTTHICSHSHVTLCTLQLLFEHILYKAVKKFEEGLLLCVCEKDICDDQVFLCADPIAGEFGPRRTCRCILIRKEFYKKELTVRSMQENSKKCFVARNWSFV